MVLWNQKDPLPTGWSGNSLPCALIKTHVCLAIHGTRGTLWEPSSMFSGQRQWLNSITPHALLGTWLFSSCSPPYSHSFETQPPLMLAHSSLSLPLAMPRRDPVGTERGTKHSAQHADALLCPSLQAPARGDATGQASSPARPGLLPSHERKPCLWASYSAARRGGCCDWCRPPLGTSPGRAVCRCPSGPLCSVPLQGPESPSVGLLPARWHHREPIGRSRVRKLFP